MDNAGDWPMEPTDREILEALRFLFSVPRDQLARCKAKFVEEQKAQGEAEVP